MPYIRKGGSGRTGTLKQQFNYYRNRLQNRLIEELSFKEARIGGTIEGKIVSMFSEENLSYEKVYTQGITRKRGNVTVRYTGEEAIAIQIGSMQRRSSKSFMAHSFINNYVSALYKQDFDYETIQKAREMLEKTSIDKLTYLMQEGILPSIQFIYVNGHIESATEEDEFLEDLKDALTKGITSEQMKNLRQRVKAYKQVNIIKRKMGLL